MVPDLSDALTYAYVMVGLRAAHFPSEKEETMLINFILRNYGGHTVDEIMIAFEMAIAGKLDMEPSEVKSYENFSVEYFSRIMNAYRAWAVKANAKIEAMLPAPPTKLLPIWELQLMEALHHHLMRDRYLLPPLKKFTSRIKLHTHESNTNSIKKGPDAAQKKKSEPDRS